MPHNGIDFVLFSLQTDVWRVLIVGPFFTTKVLIQTTDAAWKREGTDPNAVLLFCNTPVVHTSRLRIKHELFTDQPRVVYGSCTSCLRVVYELFTVLESSRSPQMTTQISRMSPTGSTFVSPLMAEIYKSFRLLLSIVRMYRWTSSFMSGYR